MASLLNHIKDGFAERALMSFILRFGGLGLQFAGGIIAARILGVAAYGSYVYAYSWSMILGITLSLGLAELSEREIPVFLSKREMAGLRRFILTTGLTIIATTAVFGVFLCVLEREDWLVLEPGWLVVALMAMVHALILAVSKALNGFHRLLTAQFLETVFRQFAQLVLVILLVVAGVSLDAYRLFALGLWVSVLILVIMLVVLRKQFLHEWGKSSHQERRAGAATLRRTWYVPALAFLVSVVTYNLQTEMDGLMIGGLMDDHAVGLYRPAARGAILMLIANTVAIQMLGPLLSQQLVEGNTEAAQRLLSRAAFMSFTLGIPIGLMLFLTAPWYLHLYGEEFVAASTAMRVLVVTQALHILTGPCSVLMVMLRHERAVVVVNAIGLLMNFVLNYLLIGVYGIEGAAAATLISIVGVKLIFLVLILRQSSYEPTVLTPIRRLLAKGQI